MKPNFKNTENPCYEVQVGDTTKKLYFSRSMATATKLTFHVSNGDGEFNVMGALMLKRSKLMTSPHKYCFPCGYIDYDESIIEGAIRELYEESGILLLQSQMKMYEVVDSPKRDKLQNVTFHFKADLYITVNEYEMFLNQIETHITGVDEVDDYLIVNKGDIPKDDIAFNHDQRLD